MSLLLLFPIAFNWAAKNWRITLIILVAVFSLGWLAHMRSEWIAEGASSETQKIEKANTEDKTRAQAAAKTVDDCAAAGGDWDRSNGVCNPAAAGK